MILQVFAVYDKAIKAYANPFYCRSRGEAIRSFSEVANERFRRSSADYHLAYLGDFDDGPGLFKQPDTGPELVISALEVMDDPKRGPM